MTDDIVCPVVVNLSNSWVPSVKVKWPPIYFVRWL